MLQSVRRVLPLLILLAPAVQAQTSSTGSGQAYPAKPVRIVAAYAPGGSVDIVARLVAQRLTEALGQQFIVENRAGASGNIGTDFVAKSAPDGYTLLMASSPALAANIHLFKTLPFDPVKDFAPIILIGNQPNVLIVHPSVPVSTVKEFIALAKSRPGKLTYATSGVGSSQHIAAELVMMMTGTSMVHVPYKGGAPALIDVVGGQVDLMFETAPSAMQYVKNGRVRSLGVTTLKRNGMLQDVPTLSEAGLSGYEFRGWIGLVGPAAVPRDIIARLNSEVQKMIDSPDVGGKLVAMGLDVAGGKPEQFAAFLREDSARYAKIVKAAKIAPL